MTPSRDPWSEVWSYREQLLAGHRYRDGLDAPAVPAAWTAKPGSHDDGPLTGLFLGGIGAPVCGRNLDGRFARWHLQTGYHVNQPIEEAFFGLRWADAREHAWKHTREHTRQGYLRLVSPPASPTNVHREVLSLFPVIHEYYHGPALPCEVVAEFYSPILPDDERAATLPLWFAAITVRNTSRRPIEVDAACFWPNLLGWRVQQMTSIDRPARSWPAQTHAGNTAVPFRCTSPAPAIAALQQRHRDRPVRDELEGEIALFTPGPDDLRGSVEACYKAGDNRIDRPPHRQKHTLAWVEDHFSRTGVLPGTDISWNAHWDEALGSAVSRGGSIEPDQSRQFSFILAFDLPLVRFGDGRRWYRKYTDTFGTSGRGALRIAQFGAENQTAWRATIDETHRRELEDARPSRSVRGAMLNELYILNGGGSAWVSRWARELDPDLPEPLLGPGEHAAILEGFDIGYYYYNTVDLWPYAWYGISRWSAAFAELVFADLAATIPLEINEERIIYRSESLAPLLVRGKVPHDLGSVMEDPWHRINGYQMRDDSNLWKDHNPAFIVSTFLFMQRCGETIRREQWLALREAGAFMAAQDEDGDGLPWHDQFGDSTWDNLGIRGRAAYSGSLTIAALAALLSWADQMDDPEYASLCRQKLEKGQQAFSESLWNGEYYRLCDSGKYADCIMGDGILGFFLADVAGLGDLIKRIDRETLRSHLESVYRYAFLQYRDGRVGPLLVAAPGTTQFSGDGGDELQVNEVIMGSAWTVAAMMYYYGLVDEADAVTGALKGTGVGPGLQFRTPAAIDGDGRFRAPMNMRPLAIWFLDLACATDYPPNVSS